MAQAVLFCATGVALLFLRALCFAFAFLVSRNFGEGLKNLAFVRKGRHDSDDGFSSESESTHYSVSDVIRATYAIHRTYGDDD